MKTTYLARILDIDPCCTDTDGSMITAYVKVQVGDKVFWCFIDEWRTGVWTPADKGKIFNLGFSLVPLTQDEKLSDKKEKIFTTLSPIIVYEHKINAQVVAKESYSREDFVVKTLGFDPNKFERIYLDCGIAITLGTVKKDLFKVGDWVEAEGRLDAYKVDNAEDNDGTEKAV